MLDKNTELTAKFESQLVAVQRATPVPTRWIGKISEFIVQGVEEKPTEKNNK